MNFGSKSSTRRIMNIDDVEAPEQFSRQQERLSKNVWFMFPHKVFRCNQFSGQIYYFPRMFSEVRFTKRIVTIQHPNNHLHFNC